MIGTDQKNPSCTALQGIIGKSTTCVIYKNRPECCRSFKASFEFGERQDRCEEARIGKGLSPLTSSDWL